MFPHTIGFQSFRLGDGEGAEFPPLPMSLGLDLSYSSFRQDSFPRWNWKSPPLLLSVRSVGVSHLTFLFMSTENEERDETKEESRGVTDSGFLLVFRSSGGYIECLPFGDPVPPLPSFQTSPFPFYKSYM